MNALKPAKEQASLARLLPELTLPAVVADRTVKNASLDSRLVQNGDLFVAIVGEKTDGKQFIDEAIKKGAQAVLVEADSNLPAGSVVFEAASVPVIAVENLKQNLSAIAGRLYQEPSAQLNLIGVTGTNGKTTCVNLLASLAQVLGRKSASVGTMGILCEGKPVNDHAMTTPDAIVCQRTLADLRSQQVSTVAMEVSSHGLSQYRVNGLQFNAAVFTNLSRDHLDYHGTMQSYAAAKSHLFSLPSLQLAVINLDDDHAGDMLASAGKKVKVVTYGSVASGADVQFSEVEFKPGSSEFLLQTPWGQAQIKSRLMGLFNVYNLTAAVTTLCAQGASFEHAVQACGQLPPVPGRMQIVPAVSDITVMVDYAHTPDALANALQAARAHNKASLWCVFGCGGDRDKGKRVQMAEVAEKYSDRIVVTSDNPRSEDPQTIIDDVVSGFKSQQFVTEVDRRKAIEWVVTQAKPGDLIVLAGKGHETYQIIGEQKLPFDDVAVAREALTARSQARAGGSQ